jgi:DNA invertase Pin-like site-specific DNA recombinase
MTAALYARVSTQDQNADMQLTELRSYAARMGWAVVEYAEKASSVKKRPVLNQLMADARLRKFDVVVVWKMDRFARSLQQLLANIQILDGCGIRFIAATQGIDTDRQNPAGRMLMQILGAVAEFERGIIVERVNSGVAQFQKSYKAGRIGKDKHSKSGKDLANGRPQLIFPRDEAVRLRAQASPVSFRKIATLLGVSVGAVQRELRKRI